MKRERRRLRRGIYLLPTCFTIGNLFCGFFSLVESSRGRFETSAVLIIIAALLGGLDGRIARMTGTTSEFGLQFDSLADIVSFGVAPAFLAFCWTLSPLRRVGWLIAFLFVICAATRLARFNMQHAVADRRYFVGLPSPPAAALVASVVFAFPAPPSSRWAAVLVAVLVVVVAFLMVGRIRYRSFKDFDLRNRRSYILVLPMSVLLVAVFTHPRIALLTLSAAYASSGWIAYLSGLARRLAGRASASSRLPGSGTSEAVEDPGPR
jgi:CDP-diacylglycerol--serine O-phosphatidyltransferase